jgi:pyruvate kinase
MTWFNLLRTEVIAMRELVLIITLNPELHTADMLAQLAHMALEAGIQLVGRLNMSFFNAALERYYANFIDKFRDIMTDIGLQPCIEIDTPGRKIRLGDNIPMILLEVGQWVVLTPYPQQERELLVIHLPYPWFDRYVRRGELILLGDDEIRLRVKAIKPERVIAIVERVREGAKLRKRMGVTIAREDLPLPLIGETDQAVMKFGDKYEIEWLGLSVIHNPLDLTNYQGWLAKNCPGWRVVPMPKIESDLSWAQMDAIILNARAAIFAKGDGLSKAIALGRAHELPKLEERFIQLTREYDRMSILATGLMTWPISQASLDSLYYIAKHLQPDAMLFPETASLSGSELLEFVETALNVVKGAAVNHIW